MKMVSQYILRRQLAMKMSLCRVLSSRAQELCCARKQLQGLRLLLTETSAIFSSIKAAPLVLATVESVLSTVHRYMLSAKHCYFSGVIP
jgi:hypothetical protein